MTMAEHDALYSILLEIKQDMGEVKAKVEALHDLPARISKIEQAKSWAHGVAATVGAIVSAVVFIITTFFKDGPHVNQ
jgi:hypothetical protein